MRQISSILHAVQTDRNVSNVMGRFGGGNGGGGGGGGGGRNVGDTKVGEEGGSGSINKNKKGMLSCTMKKSCGAHTHTKQVRGQRN